MTAEEQAARLRSIDIAEEAQMVVIWSCFSTEEDKEAAMLELDKLRADRMELFEMELSGVIENTEAPAELTDEAEKQLMEFIHALSYFDPSEISYSGWLVFCSGVAELNTPIEGLTLGQLANLLPRKRKEAV